jgi:hypothetical protein
VAEPLSPQAQAVLNAFDDHHELCGPFDGNWQELCLAAALRAVADQVVPDVTPPIDDFDEHSIGFAAAHRKYRRELLAIAAELEADR